MPRTLNRQGPEHHAVNMRKCMHGSCYCERRTELNIWPVSAQSEHMYAICNK